MKDKRTILITGAAGSIGSELTRQLAETDNVFALDQDETRLFDLKRSIPEISPILASVRDINRISEVVRDHRPEVVIHAAAYKHVGMMEMFPGEAYRTNVDGTMNVLHACRRYDVPKMILVSTDKAVDPECNMGRTKLEAEKRTIGADYTVVRFGNVMGSRGSVIPIWREQIRKGEPITITDPKMERYFMSIPEACSLILKAVEIGEPGDIMILDMGEPMTILDMALNLIRVEGRDPKNMKFIGAREGEKMKEKLMTDEEEKRAVKTDGFYVVKND